MAIVKVLYVDANGDYTEVSSASDTIQAFGFDASGQKITNVANGTSSGDVVNFSQLTAAINGLDWKPSVRFATTAPLAAATYANGASGVGATLTATANGAFPVTDGVTPALNDRLLVKDQAAGLQDGLYYISDLGSVGTPWILTRTTESDETSEVTAGLTVAIEEGTALADHIFMLMTANPITIGTTALNFQKIVVNSLVGGAGITFAGETISVDAFTSGGLQEIGAGDAGQLAVYAPDLAGTGLKDNDPTNHVQLALDFSTLYNDQKAVSAADMLSSASGKGSHNIGFHDAGGYTSQVTVEGAIEELYSLAGAHNYIVDTGGVTKGDLVYLSGVNTVKKMPINTAHVAIGLAAATVAAAGLVEVKKFDYVIAGAVAGATVDQKYWWNGSALTTTQPSTSGNYLWQAGVAINATDILADVEFVKRIA